MATRIGSAFFDVTFNTAAARREVTALVATANRQFGLLGGVALVGATVAIAGVTRATFEMGSAALQAANQYEQAFASVRKTLDTGNLSAAQSEQVFARLNQELKDLALQTPLSLSEDLAPIAALGGQLGIAAEDIKEFTAVIAEVGVTTNVSVEDAAIAFARMANIMGIPESQFRQFGDTLIHLGNNLATREDEILRFGLRIAAAGDIAGFTSDEVLALSAAMSAVGVPAERGGTAVQRVLIEITESVALADERLATFAQLSGRSAEDFAEAWRTDAGAAFVDFVEGLGAAGTDAFALLQELELGNLRTIQSFLSLANAGPLLRDSFELAGDSAEALKTEADIFFNTTEANLTRLGNTVENAGIRIGDKLQEPFNRIIDTTREWILANDDLVDRVGDNLVGALENVEVPLIRVLDALAAFAEGVSGFFADESFGQLAEDVSTFMQRGLAFDPSLAQMSVDLNLLIQGDSPQAWLARWLVPIAGGFKFLVEDQFAALTLVEENLRRALEGGARPMDALVDSFIELEARLEPFGGKISQLGFDELTNEVRLTNEEIDELIIRLLRAGVELPPELFPFERRRPRGRGGRTTEPSPWEQRQLDLLFEAEELARLQEEAEAFADTVDKVASAASGMELPIATVLDNLRLLPPELAEAVLTFGAAEVEVALFNQALQGLGDAIEFDTGNAVQQIDILTGAVEEGNTSVKEMQKNAEDALNQLAEFEARKSMFAALELDQVVAALDKMDFGTAIHAAEDLANNLEAAFELEATLDLGGVVSEETKAQLSAALATVDITPELLTMAQQFTSNEVQQVIYDAGEAAGLDFTEATQTAVEGIDLSEGGRVGGVTFGTGVQEALDTLNLSVDVALNLGVIDPRLAAMLNVSGRSVSVNPNLSTRPPTHVEVNIQSTGTTSGDAARAGQAISNIATLN